MAEENTGTGAPKRKLTWLWVTLGIVGALIIILIVLFVVLIGGAASGLTKPVNDQLALLKKGDIQGSYNMTSTQFQQATSLQDFTNVINQFPLLKNQKKISVTESVTKNADGCVKVVVSDDQGSKVGLVYRLAKEGKDWKVLVIRVNVPDSVTCSNAF